MRMDLTFEFKDGTILNQREEYPPNARSDIFYGLSNSFKNNAQIKATGNDGELLIANFDEVKSVKVSFD